MEHLRRLCASLALTAAATATLVAPATAGPPATVSAGPVNAAAASSALAAAPPTLRWAPCYRQLGPTFECATVPVPLDHSRPAGPTITLAVVRLPASDPAARRGSLFLNPGGPGGSGVDFALFAGPLMGELYGEAVRRSFDIIGMDPRGIGRSTPLRCFGTARQAVEALADVAFPVTPEQESRVAASDAVLAQQCARRGNAVGSHMSTANVARDLDLLRARSGDARLNFVGLSYGSILGVTYANMFPQRVGAVVVDGVLDPVAWRNAQGTVPSTALLGSDRGAQATLERFFATCEGAAARCAFAPGPAARFTALAERLRISPAQLVDPESGETFFLTYQDLVGITLGSLYDSFSFPSLAQFLADLEASTSPARVGASFARLQGAAALVTKRGFPNYQNFVEGFPAVLCSDSTNPREYGSWSRAGERADRTSWFGRLWTWASSPCAQWPLRDAARYDGGYTAQTANPVLVVGNTHDPATPLSGAQAVRRLLPRSSLLTVDVAGHTSFGLSSCAGRLVGAYLLDPSVATRVDGSTCPPEFDPFAASSAGAAASDQALQQGLRYRLLPEVAFRPVR